MFDISGFAKTRTPPLFFQCGGVLALTVYHCRYSRSSGRVRQFGATDVRIYVRQPQATPGSIAGSSIGFRRGRENPRPKHRWARVDSLFVPSQLPLFRFFKLQVSIKGRTARYYWVDLKITPGFLIGSPFVRRICTSGVSKLSGVRTYGPGSSGFQTSNGLMWLA